MKAYIIGGCMAFAALLSTCAPYRVDTIKAVAAQEWSKKGYRVTAYEGYTFGNWQTFGGCVWYQVEPEDNPNGRKYTGCLSKWGDEYHLYNFKSIDIPVVTVKE